MKVQTKAAPVRVWMVGSIGIDDVATREKSRKALMGGSLPYATAAASFFEKVGAVGVVGSDYPASFDRRWEAFGIDLSGVQRKAGKTFRWACRYDDNMIERETLSTELGVFGDFQPELPAPYRAAPFVLLGNIQPELQLHVLEQAKNPRFVALDTMNLWIDIALPALKRVIKRVDLLTVNDGEARLLTGKWNLRDCADSLMRMGPSYVLVKKGEHGALLFSRKGIFVVPAYPVRRLADPTGAGDTYAGAFIGYLAQAGRVCERTMREALICASVMASFCVEGFSIEKLESLSRTVFERRVKELVKMMAVAV